MIAVSNPSGRPITLIGVRVQNAEILVTDGYLSGSGAVSLDGDWSFESPAAFDRYLSPGVTIGFTVTRRVLEGAAAPGAAGVELFFADGSSLSIP